MSIMTSSSTASSSLRVNQEPLDQSVAGPLFQVKLLAALRSGDPALIHPFLAELSKEKSKSSEGSTDFGPAALHLAIRCASCDTVALFLSHRSISPNAVYPPGSGTTALHLAASIGRADIVNLLLEQPDIDDTRKDASGKTCKEVARGKDVQIAIRESRSLLIASYRALLHSYIQTPPKSPPPQELLNLLSSPRAKLIDLSYLDARTGRSLLHEAARRRDLRLIELSVRAGADVFVRDKRGKGVAEGAGLSKDDKVRVFLRQFTNQDISLLESSDSEPVTMKGYLNKFTNVAKGYNTRWFVLKDGVLSYYRHQDDEGVASRGAISLKGASLKHSTATVSDRMRFEIHSAPTRPGSSSAQQKWYIKGNHVVEVNRWVQLLVRAISWYSHDDHDTPERSAGTESENEGKSLRASVTGHFGTISGSIHRLRSRNSGHASTSSLDADGEHDYRDSSVELKSPVVGTSFYNAPDMEDSAADDSSSEVQSQRQPPHDSSFMLHGNLILAQMEVTACLCENFDLPPPLREAGVAVKDSFVTVQKMMNEYLQMVHEREDWWKKQLEKEREKGALWEESLQVVVHEGDALERELKSRIRRKSRVPTEASLEHVSTIRRKSSAIRATPFVSSPAATPTPDTPLAIAGLPKTSTSVFSQMQVRQSVLPPVPDQIEVVPLATSPSPPPTAVPVPAVPMPMPISMQDGDDEIDTDEEDEFFDAIDSNNIPNLVVTKALMSASEVTLPSSVPIDAYEGYMHLRDRLPIDADNRPPTSLWSVLKHSIGKDLTKISFPVFFNEPTSMLQRMAEDMEFSECLDAAVVEENPHKRIAFVAAFAMSNYSSTIGRIAKPFNPMLSETFEYVRFDKRYRYISEQVSHHPPISACWAESPQWHYYGEVDAQNKFMGKSFEIRPTGVAHAELMIPEKLGPNYPRATGLKGEGKVVEHYSWKKVTTNVSGFIIGSPTIDHYGDMTVINHRTGDTCILTFKPRGWRGKDAYEIYGRVMDASGRVVYEIAGRWNSQLVARSMGSGYGSLSPDVSISPPTSPSTSEYILLWRNTEKPKTPFNLTPFAITLNDCPENTLKPYICPTDCRLRPDQRAFELGRYDRANELKNEQEEFQRATRKAREEGRMGAHKPRWFRAITDGDTGERVWEPKRMEDGMLEYWRLREGVYAGTTQWNGIDKVFIADEP